MAGLSLKTAGLPRCYAPLDVTLEALSGDGGLTQ